MQKIKQLSAIQAAKIAAGEVVERPANIVKELLENSIDAQANSISIYLVDGGRQAIKIVDNGFGMSCSDAKMSIKHHATSKIESIDDLEKITTFGFRGEALSSIASISKMTLITKSGNDQAGICLKINGGDIIGDSKASCNTGTEIIIEDIFYNVPARKKFLKTKETEWRMILQIFNAFCLDYINIHFKIYSDDKIVHNCPPVVSVIDRLKQLYDNNLTNSLCLLGGDSPNGNNSMNLKIHGAITDSHYSRYDRNLIFVFVNNRWIKNYKLSQALIKGYKSVLPEGKFPAGCVFINCDSKFVDINIHPRKEEVLFLHPKIVESFLEDCVKKALEETVLNKLSNKVNISLNNNLSQNKPIDNIKSSFKIDSFQNFNFNKIKPEMHYEEKPIEKSLNNKIEFEKNLLITNDLNLEYKLLGQFDKTYILIETDNGLTLVDQHAAHERVLYEKFENNFSSIDNFSLIVPKVISVGSHGIELLNDYLDLFAHVGLHIDIIGSDQIVIKQVPIYLKNKSLDCLVKDLIENILNEKSTKLDFKTTLIKSIRAQISCSSAIKAGDVLNIDSMKNIIESLFKIENRLTCPHGRPTLWLLNNFEIEKKFKRDYR